MRLTILYDQKEPPKHYTAFETKHFRNDLNHHVLSSIGEGGLWSFLPFPFFFSFRSLFWCFESELNFVFPRFFSVGRLIEPFSCFESIDGVGDNGGLFDDLALFLHGLVGSDFALALGG